MAKMGRPVTIGKLKKNCLYCNAEFEHWPAHKNARYCSRFCGYRNRRAENSHLWTGGRRKAGKYVQVYSPAHPFAVKAYMLEHRLVMEKSIGRYLSREEIVHHINGDTLDNRPENLQIVDRASHMTIHRTGYKHTESTKQRMRDARKRAKLFG